MSQATRSSLVAAQAVFLMCVLGACGDQEAETPDELPVEVRTIRGRVLAGDGAAVQALPVRAFVGLGHPVFRGKTDQDGRFLFDELPNDKPIGLALDTLDHGLRVSQGFGIGLDSDFELAIGRGKDLDVEVPDWVRKLELSVLWRVTELDDPGILVKPVKNASSVRLKGVPADHGALVVLRDGMSSRVVAVGADERSLEVSAPDASARILGEIDFSQGGSAGQHLVFVAEESVGMDRGSHEAKVASDGTFACAIDKNATYLLMIGDAKAKRVVLFRSGLRSGSIRLPAADTIDLQLRVVGLRKGERAVHVEIASQNVVLFSDECVADERGNVDVGQIARARDYSVIVSTRDQVGTAKVSPGKAAMVQLESARMIEGSVQPAPHRPFLVVAEYGEIRSSAERNTSDFRFPTALPRVPMRLRVYCQGATAAEVASGVDPLQFRPAGHIDIGPDVEEVTIPYRSLFD